MLHHVVHEMPDHVESRFGRHVIANPVEPGENFADRWIGHPGRARRFFEWLEAAQRDFTAIGDAQDIDGMVDRTALALGIRAARAAERTISTAKTARQSAVVATRIPAGSDRFA